MTTHSSNSPALQTAIGAAVVLVGAGLGAGALVIPSAAGYAGIGPDFMAWMMAAALVLCGVLLVRHARAGGYRDMEVGSGAERGDVPALLWVCTGILADAALLTTIGFVLANALCFTLAVRGMRASEGKPPGGVRQALIDVATGTAIAAPAFWLFTKLLGINLPGLTTTGWI